MSESTSPAYLCRSCGTKIFRKSNVGRIPELCKPCRKEKQRISIRDYGRRQRAGIRPSATFVCEVCAGVFPRVHRDKMPPKYCADCWRARETARGSRRTVEAMSALREKFETEGRWTKCETCSVDIRCLAQKGQAPRWCVPCREARRREQDQIKRPWARSGRCVDCGGTTGRASRSEIRPRCWSCMSASRDDRTGQWIARVPASRRAIAEEFGLRAARLRGEYGDSYTAYDIYERDRWICQICSRKVNKRLRHPHRLSATIDHIIPVSHGGTDARANVRLAHLSCNASRQNRGGGEQLALLG